MLKFHSDGLLTFNLVVLPVFRHLVTGLQPGSTVISRVTVRKQMADAVVGMKKNLGDAFRMIDWVLTTTDCWSTQSRSYIGVTAHWIDAESMCRVSAALACRRLTGSHTTSSWVQSSQHNGSMHPDRETEGEKPG